MIQIILYSIGVCIALCASTILLISVTTRKKRSKRNKIVRVVVANLIIAITLLLLYPYHILGVNLSYFLWTFPVLLTLLLDAIALNRIFSGDRPDQEILNAWHDDPANWRLGLFYYNPDDHRIMPPKRIEGFGWTINFANVYSILVFIIMLAFVLLFFRYISTLSV